MAMKFDHRVWMPNDLNSVGLLSMQGELSPEDTARLSRIRRAWNFYDGYHWEEIPPSDKPEITQNYCRKFVDKFVETEFGKGFYIAYPENIEGEVDVSNRKKIRDKNDREIDITEYLESVWKDNNKYKFCIELGQSKSVTGDGWVHVRYFSKDDLDDPFNEYENGRIRVVVVPTGIVFPEYDPHDKDKLVKVTIAYPIQEEETTFTRRTKLKTVVYKIVWTNEYVEEWKGSELIKRVPNKYGVIPFVQIKNFPVVGREEGVSDLEDIIPLNVELNTKLSDISEILDYHSAPITLVFGAKVSNLEKGANKVWGGLPKDSRVENLELRGDLGACLGYISDLKKTICEIGSIPQDSLGGKMAISNTSGVALAYANLPLIERVRVKKVMSKEGLEKVNKLILLISLKEGLIKKPDNLSFKEFYDHEVIIPDTLPRDELTELKLIETEFRLALEHREGALKRLGRRNIKAKIKEIDKDRRLHPDVYGLDPNTFLQNPDSFINSNKEGEPKKIVTGDFNSPEPVTDA